MLKNDNVNSGPYFISALFKRKQNCHINFVFFIGQDFEFWFILSLVHMFVQFVTTATEINSVLNDFSSLKMRFNLDF